MQKVSLEWVRGSHMAPTEFLPEYVYGFCKSQTIIKLVTQLSFRELFFPSSCHQKNAPFCLKLALTFGEIKSGEEEQGGGKERKRVILLARTSNLIYQLQPTILL